MEQPFNISISQELTAPGIRVDSPTDLSYAIDELNLDISRPVLVIIGGASKISESDLNRLRLLFIKVLAPLAEELGLSVVDGGTDAGVMQMIGQARGEIGATFPLIGVTPVGKIALPNQNPPEDVTPLEPNHTHFVLIPGSEWGDESPWLVNVASAIANGCPSVAVLVNGGEISRKDVSENLKANRPVLAVAGSGRFADILIAALGGESSDSQAKELAASGLIKAIDLKDDFDNLTQSIKSYFLH
ncbi:MAG: hypothetical protein MJK14_28710 [Rivularia sp. ALOHA_DT_140]|nr:hypothetical protein [Rivularia sp. ALOHA_DT_140]